MEGHFDVDSLLLNPSRSLLNELSELDGHWSGKGQEVSYERGELPPVEPSENFPLGMGGAGSVFKVVWKHPKSKKQITFAEKRVSPSKNFPKELAKVEVTLLKKLQHRHIVSFVGSYEHNCIFHILILPCATCDLARLLDDLDRAKGQASPVPYFTELGWINPTSSADGGYFRRHAHERLGKLCGCITSAVLYLHDKKIRHKDIKPSNILIDRHSVYLTDFNVSKDFEEQDTTQTIGSTIHGTQRYLAPEIVKRETRGSKADIYSLGLVFMEIFTFLSGHSRQDMFDALGYDTGLERHLGTDRKRIAIYSSLRLGWAMTLLPPVELESKSGTRDLLLGMLHIDPSQRPDAYEVASQLATLDPDGKLHGECCQPHKGSVGFKALIAKYDNLREQHDQLLNRYEDMNREFEECRSERDIHKAGIEELKAKWESAMTIQRPATPGGRPTSDTMTNPWSNANLVSQLRKSSDSNIPDSNPSEMNMGHRDAELSWRQQKSMPQPQDTIPRNRNHNRIDKEAIAFAADWTDSKRKIWNEMKNLNLCRFDYLGRHGCYNTTDCPYVHEADHAISERERDVYRAFVRKQPCANGTSCSYDGCIFGHHCLDKNYPCDFMRNGKKCPFPRELHIGDFNVVTGTVVK